MTKEKNYYNSALSYHRELQELVKEITENRVKKKRFKDIEEGEEGGLPVGKERRSAAGNCPVGED